MHENISQNQMNYMHIYHSCPVKYGYFLALPQTSMH